MNAASVLNNLAKNPTLNACEAYNRVMVGSGRSPSQHTLRISLASTSRFLVGMGVSVSLKQITQSAR